MNINIFYQTRDNIYKNNNNSSNYINNEDGIDTIELIDDNYTDIYESLYDYLFDIIDEIHKEIYNISIKKNSNNNIWRNLKKPNILSKFKNVSNEQLEITREINKLSESNYGKLFNTIMDFIKKNNNEDLIKDIIVQTIMKYLKESISNEYYIKFIFLFNCDEYSKYFIQFTNGINISINKIINNSQNLNMDLDIMTNIIPKYKKIYDEEYINLGGLYSYLYINDIEKQNVFISNIFNIISNLEKILEWMPINQEILVKNINLLYGMFKVGCRFLFKNINYDIKIEYRDYINNLSINTNLKLIYKIKILDILDIIKYNLKVNDTKIKIIDTTPRYVVNKNNKTDNKRRKNNRSQKNNNSNRWR